MSSSALNTVLVPGRGGVRVSGIAHVAVNVASLPEAKAFYCDVLGFREERGATVPDCGEHLVVRAASGQRVALCRRPGWTPLAESGVHNAYRVTSAAREGIAARLRAADVSIFSYKEMRDSEQADNFYFCDPAGNRIQLVTTPSRRAAPSSDSLVDAVDHVAVQSYDVEWEEEFYIGLLGLSAVEVVGWRTTDYVRARSWGEGNEDMAPGTMRWDRRFHTYPGQTPNVARPNVQMFVGVGGESLGVYLANKHFQAPPEDSLVGTPRVALAVTDRADLDRLAELLRAAGKAFVGPIAHPASSPWACSLYCKDPGFNFLEFCC